MATFFKKPKYSKVVFNQRRDIPDNLYTRCPMSREIIYNKDLEKNLMVVPKSGYHFPLDAPRRIQSLVDNDSFEELDTGLTPLDPLEFKGLSSYKDKLAENQKKTGLNDAVIVGMGKIDGIKISLAVMDFRFLGGSMGSVVGEKITRSIERAAERKTPLVIVSASGGARMYEGILSLMQMAKTSAALARLHEEAVPYFSVFTNPTYAGVTASFASLGDVNLAEPGALIGFAGARVIKEGTGEELPKGFQTAEFLLEHGMIDQIVPRHQLRDRLITLMHALYLRKEPAQGNNDDAE